MKDKEKEKIVCDLIEKGDTSREEILEYVKNECRDVDFTPRTLGMLFECYAGIKSNENDPSSFFSKEYRIDELEKIHPGFRSKNGCQWARSDNCYLGKKYVIKREHEGGCVSSVKLEGSNDKSLKRNRGIKKEIIDEISKRRCVILDVGSQIECDHKDGHYDVLSNQSTETQKITDFQALSKAANDAKRSHCNECKKTGKRYDARKLGYSQAFILGDENTSVCQGCYWYDPKYFNEVISKGFKKEK